MSSSVEAVLQGDSDWTMGRFELCGVDERDLVRRIGILREAIRMRRGAIVEIDWRAGDAKRGRAEEMTAVVRYRVPALDGR